MAEQISAWIVLIAGIAAVWLLIDYWRIRRARPDLFSKWTQGDGEIEDHIGTPEYWLPGSLDLRNPERHPSSGIESPRWTSFD